MGTVLPRMSHYPGGFNHGLTIREIPLHMAHPGETFWVDENASSPGRGTFRNPDISIESCMSRCVADRGDIITVKAGHVENISETGGITCDVAGVAIVGTGRGSKQAKIEWDTTENADIDVTAANVTFSNLWLYNNYADVDGAFDVAAGGDYFTIQDCIWTDGSNSLDLEEGINLAVGANYFAFIGNTVKFYTGSDTESLVLTQGESIDITVTGNSIIMAASAAIFALNATALTGTPLFRDNFMLNLDNTATVPCVALNSATVAMFANERQGSDKSAGIPASDISASFMIECHGTDQNDTSSLIWPTSQTVWT